MVVPIYSHTQRHTHRERPFIKAIVTGRQELLCSSGTYLRAEKGQRKELRQRLFLTTRQNELAHISKEQWQIYILNHFLTHRLLQKPYGTVWVSEVELEVITSIHLYH